MAQLQVTGYVLLTLWPATVVFILVPVFVLIRCLGDAGNECRSYARISLIGFGFPIFFAWRVSLLNGLEPEFLDSVLIAIAVLAQPVFGAVLVAKSPGYRSMTGSIVALQTWVCGCSYLAALFSHADF